MIGSHSFIYIILGLYFIFAIGILLRAKRNVSRWKVAILAILTGLWITSFEMLKNSATVGQVDFWIRTLFVSCTLVIYLMYSFSLEFIGRKWKWLSERSKSVLAITILMVTLLLFTSLIFKGLNPVANNLVEKAPPGKLFLLLLMTYIYIFINMLINFIYAYQNSLGIVRKQIVYAVSSMLLVAIIAFITAGLLPAMKITNLIWLAPYSSFIYVAGMTYTIFKYRLLDLEIIIKRTSLYLLLVAFITGIYTFLLMLPQKIFGMKEDHSFLLMLLSAGLIAFTLQPLRDWLDRVTDRIFYQKRYNYYKVLEHLARELSVLIKVEEIVWTTSSTLLNTLHLDKVGIYLKGQTDRSVYKCINKDGENAEGLVSQLDEEDPLIAYLVRTHKPIITDEFLHYYGYLFKSERILDKEKFAVYQSLVTKLSSSLVIPLWLKQNMIGFLALGSKRSGDQFTDRDLTLLETISSQMAVILENAKLYERMLANERLTVIGSLAAGIAHEIRNPLASIKTFIQMLPEKYSQSDFKERFHTIVGSEIERLSNITADLLTFARPSAPKLDTVSMDQLMDKVRTLLANQLRKKQVELTWDLSLLPSIQADPQQIFQVFLNTVLNAIHASREKGQIKVYGEIKDHVPGHPDGRDMYMLITVEDLGTGIKRKDLVNLFQPFFTTKTEGTGLGLATCKRILEAHRGEITIESEEGKGTKVKVMLPTNLTQDTVIIPTIPPIRELI